MRNSKVYDAERWLLIIHCLIRGHPDGSMITDVIVRLDPPEVYYPTLIIGIIAHRCK